jgi:hypothetical protein
VDVVRSTVDIHDHRILLLLLKLSRPDDGGAELLLADLGDIEVRVERRALRDARQLAKHRAVGAMDRGPRHVRQRPRSADVDRMIRGEHRRMQADVCRQLPSAAVLLRRWVQGGAKELRLRRVDAGRVVNGLVLWVTGEEALKPVGGGREHAFHPAVLGAELELRPAVALADPEKAAVGQPTRHVFAQVHPRRVGLAQELRSAPGFRIGL